MNQKSVMKHTIIVLGIFLILVGSVSALNLQINDSRLQYPESAKLDIDLGQNLFDWENVQLDVSIEGKATFADGTKNKTYSYAKLTDNLVIAENILLEENTKIEDTVTINAHLEYTTMLVGGFSKKSKSDKSVEIIGFWVDKVECESMLVLCERETSKKDELTADLVNKVTSLKEQMAKLEAENNQLKETIKEKESKITSLSTKATINQVFKWGFIIAGILLVFTIIGMAAYYRRN